MDFFLDPWSLGPWMLLGVLLCASSLLANYGRFRAERGWLRKVELALQERASAEEVWLAVSTGSGIPANSITLRRVEMVRRLEGTDVPVHAGILSDIAVAGEDALRSNALSTFLLSTFLIVGLGGTFLALKELLRNSPLKDVASSGQISTERLQVAIDQIYQGFGGAFYASITGIAATVLLLGLRVILVTPERDKFFSRLDEITQTCLVPTFRIPHKDSESHLYLVDVSNKLQKTFEQATALTEELSHHGAEAGAVVENLGSFVAEVRSAVDDLAEMFGVDSELQNAVFELVKFNAHADERHQSVCERIDKALSARQNNVTELRKLAELAREQNDQLAAIHTQSRAEAESEHRAFISEIRSDRDGIDRVLASHSDRLKESVSAFGGAVALMSKPNSPEVLAEAMREAIGPTLQRLELAISNMQRQRALSDSGSEFPRHRATPGESKASLPGCARAEEPGVPAPAPILPKRFTDAGVEAEPQSAAHRLSLPDAVQTARQAASEKPLQPGAEATSVKPLDSENGPRSASKMRQLWGRTKEFFTH